jgi:hypothetical protein
MYSEKVVLAGLEAFERANGWMPRYHTTDEVDEFIAYVDGITNIDRNTRNSYIDLRGKMTKRRADEIRRFVENEQALCCLDSSYWETRYAYISTESGDIKRFQNRDSQKVFDAIIAQFDEDQVAIELLCLKARQMGVSTKVALKFTQRLQFLSGTKAVMASADAEKSELLTRMLTVCLQKQPWWLGPRKTQDRIEKMAWDNDSVLSVQSGKQATGIAQGWTPNCVHISEIGDIPNPKKVLEEGLFRATHSSRRLFAVYEGTGNGNTGWQADKWRAAKEDWPRGRSRLCPIFIPWPLAPDLYPEKDWVRKYPVPSGWQPHKATRDHVRRCELYIRNTPYLSKVCGKNWKMSMEQQWFWEFNYDENVKSHTSKIWASQMPADDFEALTGKNDAVFDPEVIEVVTRARGPQYVDYTSYAITGDTIDDVFLLDTEMVDYTLPRIRVHWESHRGTKYDWVMVPLLPFDQDDQKLSYDRVLIFEHPKPGYDYTIGIDTADGLGKEDDDRSVCSITHNVKGDGCDQQVAEFVSNRVNAPQMVGFAACMAAYFGEHTADPRGCKFAIEQRMRAGDDCQLQLKLMGFNHHHVMTRYDSKTVKENRGQQLGWFTNQWSRPMLMNRFVDAITNGWYQPNSPFLIQELRELERKRMTDGRSRLEHQSGKHDDRVMSAAMSYFSFHALDVMSERAQKRYAPPTGKNPELDYSYSNSNEISVGSW